MTDPNPYEQNAYPNAVPGQPAQPAPPYGYPAAAQQGYPVAPQAYPAAPGGYYLQPNGRKYWGLTFLLYIPYVGWLVALIVTLVQRSATKASPLELARENARWAANWVLSYVLYFFVALALLITVGISTTPAGGGDPSGAIAFPALLLVAVGIYCLVTMIRGTVRGATMVHRPALAIPFFRS